METYYGIDLSEKYTMISFCSDQQSEPETVSTIAGSENFQIPTFLAKRNGVGQWFFGEEAKSLAATGQAVPVDNILSEAILGNELWIDGQCFEARELLAMYIKRVLSLPGKLFATHDFGALVITMQSIDEKAQELFSVLPGLLEIERDRLFIMERREAFTYYALNQDTALWNNDVALIDYSLNKCNFTIMMRSRKSTPQTLTFLEHKAEPFMDDKDKEFAALVDEVLSGRIVSAAYLTGEGFEGDWMKLSLNSLCKGRRVFMGQNLYSKGASYAARVKGSKLDWPYVYMGDNELKMNLLVKVYDQGTLQFKNLLTAGKSWYDCESEFEVLLDGSPEIEVLVQRPDSRGSNAKMLHLSGLPERPPKTTRLRIGAKALSDRAIKITVRDLGFGEIFKSSGKSWDFSVSLESRKRL